MAEQKGAAPPGGGRMDHEAMERASELPVSGPAASDTLAASGGLERPGRAAEPETADHEADREDAARMPPPTLTSVNKLDREKESEQ